MEETNECEITQASCIFCNTHLSYKPGVTSHINAVNTYPHSLVKHLMPPVKKIVKTKKKQVSKRLTASVYQRKVTTIQLAAK